MYLTMLMHSNPVKDTLWVLSLASKVWSLMLWLRSSCSSLSNTNESWNVPKDVSGAPVPVVHFVAFAARDSLTFFFRCLGIIRKRQKFLGSHLCRECLVLTGNEIQFGIDEYRPFRIKSKLDCRTSSSFFSKPSFDEEWTPSASWEIACPKDYGKASFFNVTFLSSTCEFLADKASGK